MKKRVCTLQASIVNHVTANPLIADFFFDAGNLYIITYQDAPDFVCSNSRQDDWWMEWEQKISLKIAGEKYGAHISAAGFAKRGRVSKIGGVFKVSAYTALAGSEMLAVRRAFGLG
jgi:hypothetical protein